MPFRSVPGQASVAEQSEGGKLFAPSAARNLEPLLQIVSQHAPQRGRALEIASGTGQHVIGYARALPDIAWHPSDIDPSRRASIDAYASEAGLTNIAPAAALDATTEGWGALIGPFDLIVLSNLLHLISNTEAQNLLSEAATALTRSGRLLIYGPFSREGLLVSEGDKAFHAALTEHDPDIGYKNVETVSIWAAEAGLQMAPPNHMPANNLCLVFSPT